MKLLIPAGIRDLPVKEKWIRTPICQRAVEKCKLVLGFQVSVTQTDCIENLNGFVHPFGIHFPNRMADDWPAMRRLAERVARLNPQPLFAVIHGKKVASSTANDYLVNFSNSDWFAAFAEMEHVINELKELGIPVAMENTALTNFCFQQGRWRPETYLDVRIGGFVSDLMEIAGRTSCQLVVDVEHLAFSLNLLNRQAEYQALPKQSARNPLLGRVSFESGKPPSAVSRFDLWKTLDEIPAEVYHFAGSPALSENRWQEICEGKISSHMPVSENDTAVRRFLDFINKKDKESLGGISVVPEVSHQYGEDYFGKRGPNSQQQSLEAVCKILLGI